jgi:hypothetical protein
VGRILKKILMCLVGFILYKVKKNDFLEPNKDLVEVNLLLVKCFALNSCYYLSAEKNLTQKKKNRQSIAFAYKSKCLQTGSYAYIY